MNFLRKLIFAGLLLSAVWATPQTMHTPTLIIGTPPAPEPPGETGVFGSDSGVFGSDSGIF